MADPDVEVSVDPRAGKDRWQRLPRLRARLAHGHRAQFRMRLEAAVERSQEWPPLSVIVFPGVLPVEDDEDGGLFPAGARLEALPGLAEPAHEVLGRDLAVPPGVGEADQV